jgi:hypothetical protein
MKKWDIWKTFYILIAIPVSLEIGIAINTSPHRQAIVVFMMLLLAIKHHTRINSIPETIERWMLALKGSTPK